jgi:type I restriction enzyme S subunit
MPAIETTPTEVFFKGNTVQEERRHEFVESGWLVSIPLTTVPLHWLTEGDQRLDAGYYSNEIFAASQVLHDSPYPVKKLNELGVTAYHPTQNQPRSNFKRILTTPDKGTPFLSTGEMYDFRPAPNKYLSPAMKKLHELLVRPGTLLMSRSGTVAIPVLVNKRLARYAATDDAIRISPGNLCPGYLYAFLSTWIGRASVSKSQYGIAVKHLEAHHLISVECPVLPDIEQQAIHLEIQKAYDMRDEANDQLDDADEMLHRALGLPRFDVNLIPYLTAHNPGPKKPNRPAMPHPKAFSVSALIMGERFDASFHDPVARTAIQWLGKSKFELARLGDLANEIVVAPRFKRIYVSKEYGVPFLQGSHLPQMRPYDLKYLSRSQQKGLERWIVHKGWVLITCSGTIGRIGLVSSYHDQWAASQHLLRIIPDYSRGHPGYLAAFLMTPYGQHQLRAKTYGGVVDEITADDTAEVRVPYAPPEVQAAIGEKVISAYEKKDEASVVEEAAIKRLEALLEKRPNK